jgi:molecular chaperone GrpE
MPDGAEGAAEGDVDPADLLEEERQRYLRLAAEFDNFRKRSERDMQEYRRRATDVILMDLLDVVDNLDRALDASCDADGEELVAGLTAIRNQMGAILDREGVEPVDSMGLPFDPYEMEAVMRMPSRDVSEGNVMQELQRGYRARGHLLRPSKVIVSSGPEGTDESGEPK